MMTEFRFFGELSINEILSCDV